MLPLPAERVTSTDNRTFQVLEQWGVPLVAAPKKLISKSVEAYEGDDISVEAIADSNPDWMLVLDRDGAIHADEPDYTEASRIIALILSGAAMAMSGLVMQLLTQNRFVEPTTTGTTEWAGMGLLLCIIFFPNASILLRMVAAVIFPSSGRWSSSASSGG